MAQHEIIGGGAFLDQNIKDINHNFDELFAGEVNTLDAPVTLISSGTVGTYSLLNSGLVIKNAAGTELLRIWASDPNKSHFNSGNLYVGQEAGLAQPSDNTTAAYYSTGIGYQALAANAVASGATAVGFQAFLNATDASDGVAVGANAARDNIDGYDIVAVGSAAALANQHANNLTAVGSHALLYASGGDGVTAVGYKAGLNPDNDIAQYRIVADTLMTLVGAGATKDNVATLTNSTALGAGAIVSASNRAVIGDGSVTDVYLGSETPVATLHAKVAQISAGAFANLPGTPVEGMIAVVNNANTNTWGATITGAGANHVLAYYNGSAWTVMAK